MNRSLLAAILSVPLATAPAASFGQAVVIDPAPQPSTTVVVKPQPKPSAAVVVAPKEQCDTTVVKKEKNAEQDEGERSHDQKEVLVPTLRPKNRDRHDQRCDNGGEHKGTHLIEPCRTCVGSAP